jgi:polyisoprenoid-binding protein YceI
MPGESTPNYSIDENFLNENNALATVMGKASQVEGEFVLNYDHPLASEFGLFTANLKTPRSDQPERDDAVRTQWLGSDHYPMASFQPKELRDFPSDVRAGDPVRFQLAGDVTIKDVTAR